MIKIQKLACLFLFLFSISTSNAQIDSVRMYLFGHSLFDHRPPAIPTPSDETSITHWLHLLTQHQGDYYAATGQYGFLSQQAANLPPHSNWWYDIVPPVWDSGVEPFSDADFNTILMTAGNFMQWQESDVPLPGEGGETIVSFSETVIDWLEGQEDPVNIYIYENWPDMATYIAGELFPPSGAEFLNYNNYTTGGFHDWWVEYQDFLLASRPATNVRMIPVGPILAQLFRDGLLSNIPVTDLYEDNAPHGRPTVYFLAALTTYMAINNVMADVNYTVPAIIHADVATNYSAVVNFIWSELNSFNESNGDSRVFANTAALGVELYDFEATVSNKDIQLDWMTTTESNNNGFEIERSFDGKTWQTIGFVNGKGVSNEINEYQHIDTNPFVGINYYRLKQIDFDESFEYSEVITVKLTDAENDIQIFPNPVKNELFVQSTNQSIETISVMNNIGQVVFFDEYPQGVQGHISIDVSAFSKGIYFIQIKEKSETISQKIVIQ